MCEIYILLEYMPKLLKKRLIKLTFIFITYIPI